MSGISMTIIEIQPISLCTRKNSAPTTWVYHLVLKSATYPNYFFTVDMKSNSPLSTRKRLLMMVIKSIKYQVGSVIVRKVFNMEYWQGFNFRKESISSL